MVFKKEIALVLSGGGAWGAYEAGSILALSEHDPTVKAISSSSVGALNGLCVIGSKNLKDASIKLQKIWFSLKKEDILGNDIKMQLRTDFLESLLENSVNFSDIENRNIEMWVTLYKTQGSLVDFTKWLLDISENSIYVKINGKSKQEILKYVISSCSLPFISKKQEINGQYFRDGGLGRHANIPASIFNGSKYKNVIVYKMVYKDYFNPKDHDFDSIVISPNKQENLNNDISSIVNFDSNNLKRLFEIGYKDTLKILALKS